MTKNAPTITYDKILISSLTLPAFSYPASPTSNSIPQTLDCWSKPRPQPTSLSVFLHLKSGYLDICASSDDVQDSVHYGLLTKRIGGLMRGGGENHSKGGENETDKRGIQSPEDLIKRVSSQAFDLSGDVAEEVRVIVDMPKYVLLAGGFAIDAVTVLSDSSTTEPIKIIQKHILIKDLIIPVIIGVNPPERLSKQRVIVNITFEEDVETMEEDSMGRRREVDYQGLVKDIYETLSSTSYLTLEKFAVHIARIGLSSSTVKAVCVCAQKPSALSFADSSGVEVRRTRGGNII